MKRADHIGPPFLLVFGPPIFSRNSINLAASIQHVALDPCRAGDFGYTASGFSMGIHAELLHAPELDLVSVYIFG
ncbi:putative ABC transporter, ATP-binding protein [Roseibium sp. TrichSKD4]|nr:putative ABC transporter, ATP-binding protein [Roseibium sp. TrichSKD4]